MAKKKEPDANDASTWEKKPDIITNIHPDDAELDEVLAGLPQADSSIELFRVNPLGGRPLYLESVDPKMFSLAYVTAKFGGGRYTAHAKYLTGDRVRIPFDIEGEPIPVKRLGPGAGAEPIVQQQTQNNLRSWTENPHQHEFEQVPTDQSGAFAVLTQLIRDMKTSKADMYKEMLMMKELFGSNQQTGPQATIEQVTQMLMRGIELGGKAGGAEPNFWVELAREFKEPLGKALDTLQVALSTRNQPAQVNPPVPRPTQAPPSMSASGETMTQEPNANVAVMKQLQQMLPVLINGAAKNSDPATYVDMLLDQVQESLYPTLRDWLVRPDCLDMLANFEPGIRYQQEWWMTLRGGILEALTEEIGHGLTSVQSPENPKPATVNSTDSDSVA